MPTKNYLLVKQTARPRHSPFSPCLPSHFLLFIFNHQSLCCLLPFFFWSLGHHCRGHLSIIAFLPLWCPYAFRSKSNRCGCNSLGWGFRPACPSGREQEPVQDEFPTRPLLSLAARAVQDPPLLVPFPSVDHFLWLSVKLWCNRNKYLAFVTSYWYRVPKPLLIIWLTGASSAIPNKLVESNLSLC